MADEQKPEQPSGAAQDPTEPPPSEPKAATPAAAAESASASEAAPDAILARLSNLDPDDDGDAATREAEAKLAERRAEQSKLQRAASKKLDKIGSKPKKKASQKRLAEQEAEAEERRSAGRSKQAAPVDVVSWIQKRAKGIAAATGLLLFAGFSLIGVRACSHSSQRGATQLLMQAEALQRAAVGPAETPREDAPPDRRKRFDTEQARAEAALAKYREVSSQYAGSGAGVLAKLSEGALLLDLRDGAGALAAFEVVKGSDLAKEDQQVRGRALEGTGFAHELQGDLEAAAKSYRELENTVTLPGFKELALYHQGRIAEAQGEKDKAIEQFKAAYDKASDPRNQSQMVYIKTVAEERLRALDPNALPKESLLGAGMGGGQMGEADLRAMQEMIQKQIEEAQKKAAEGKHDDHPEGQAQKPAEESASQPAPQGAP